MSLIQLNYAFLVVLKHFGGNLQKTSLFIQKKVTITERSSEILRKITFLKKFEKE